MSGERRRLAAIVSADVAGYSRLMGRDESGTLAALKALRSDIVDPGIEAHRGRIVKTTGDGLLLEFASVVDAVRCVSAMQSAMAAHNEGVPPGQRIQFRIGVNIGDVIIDGDDIFGDGVNVAARLQELAPVGGICVSGRVHEDVRDKLDIAFEDAGERQLKNIARPVRAYTVRPRHPAPATQAPPSLPDKPSIAVLPFTNMSAEAEQEYFADGVAEDLITTLSKIPDLMVIARNSSFVFRGQARDVRDIGRTLGVRYILEGSVRRSGDRVRLTAQLVDSLDGSHRWADRFDGDLHDVFDLQDRITQDIVTALEVTLTHGEQARIWRKRSGSPLVYEHYLKAREYYINFARHTHAQAKAALEHALAINPAFTPALTTLGFTLTDQARFGWVEDRAAAYQAAHDCAARALSADPDWGGAYMVKGYAWIFQRRHDAAVEAGEKAIALSPNSADGYHMAGMFHGYAGDFRKAAIYEEHAQRLSPISRHESMVDQARARFHLGDFVAARDIALRVLKVNPRWLTAQTTLVAALWSSGNEEEARARVRELLAGSPGFSVERWARGLPYRRQEHLDALLHPLRMAGVPER